jgi:hypothetical protein
MKFRSTLFGMACAIITPVVFAQTETTTTTTVTTSSGTLTEYAPGSTFVVRETSGPVSYRYGDRITYVTRGGQPLTEEQVRTRVKVGAPVNVHYIIEGEDRVIDRVEIDDIEIEED